MKILGIETSCDETAVAIVDDKKNILANCLNSQIKIHEKYGGVVPEIAARGHVEILDELIEQALKEANLTFEEIDGFAATCGPGLIGGVIIGMMAAKTLASIYKKPFLAINHLEGHALTTNLTSEVSYPFLLLLISGGHCQILNIKNFGSYEKIGETIDDALGESFDKVAQMLDLPYPGGPIVEKLAKEGDENRFKFSLPLITSKNHDHKFNFSFSGLKTSVRREIENLTKENFSHLTTPKLISKTDKRDICASFQKIVCDIIKNRLNNIFNELQSDFPANIVIAGGVAANQYILESLKNWCQEKSTKQKEIKLTAPPIKLCTDNAVMIAWVGVEKMQLSKFDDLEFKPQAKWNIFE
jgi:N6-L-threonylcarbamoyladenine synthase